MGRKRFISPEYFEDEDLASLVPITRLLYIAMWTAADKEGRLGDRPVVLKNTLLMFDDVDPEELLSELHEHEYIKRYDAAWHGKTREVHQRGDEMR